MYQCFHCGKKAVIWDSDFSFSDLCYDLEGEDGIVHMCHCTHCGAEIEYRIPFDKEPEDAVIA